MVSVAAIVMTATSSNSSTHPVGLAFFDTYGTEDDDAVLGDELVERVPHRPEAAVREPLDRAAGAPSIGRSTTPDSSTRRR